LVTVVPIHQNPVVNFPTAKTITMKAHPLLRSLLLILICQAPQTNAFGQADRTPTGAISKAGGAEPLAETPPMGWNSWDGYGATIDESRFKANAEWLAEHLKPFGWQYVVIDAEWFVANPTPEGSSKTSQFVLDTHGRYTPVASRFPTAAGGAGFKPIADYVHSLGLKFGIHILRGIPKQAVEKNLTIAGTSYHARDAADTSDTCPWNFDNYGLDARKPAAEAYYDSIAELYASWGVDLVKVDCISSHPYKGDEIRLLGMALEKTGRPIVLSLSPGPAPLEKTDEMGKYAEMWRISNDIWDLWHNDKVYPKGVGDQFALAAEWATSSGSGHWPDADMLPLGRLGPAPGWGKARETRLTHDEQRTLMTLWCILRSPLMVGGDLTASNPWNTALLTNSEVLAVDQHSADNHVVTSTDKTVVWLAKSPANGYYLAVFNTGESTKELHFAWKQLRLEGAEYRMRDLWEHKDLSAARSLDLTLPAHASALYRLTVP
jgi:alpha-galactosidase